MSTPTARSTLHLKRRPSSAIFLGISPVPDLPEPPSPGGTTSSGLPSPPATDSTGSGSQGDVGASYMNTATHAQAVLDNDLSASSHDQDYDNDYDIEEEDTARLDRLQPTPESSENALALQRVKSLTQRNRMVLDKLNRLSSPSPGPSNRSSRSSNASSSGSTTSRSRLSATHSRALSTASISASHQPLTRASLNSLSGSETERESNYSSHPYSESSHPYAASSIDDLSTPLQPTQRAATPPRTRLRSAPTSPAKALTRASRRSSPGPGARTTLREVSVPKETFSSTANKRTRQPLPREFRDGRLSMEPITPHREAPSPAPSNRSPTIQALNRSPRAPRFSTVRDTSKRHQSRWVSEDMSNGSIREDGEFPAGRVQSTRGGSADSMLTAIGGAGGRLVGESLRAAGISMRRGPGGNDDDDGEGFGTARRRLVDFSRASSRLDDRKDNDATYGRRAATSMADYHNQRQEDQSYEEEVGSRATPLRTYRSASGILDSDRAPSSMSRYAPPSTPGPSRTEYSAYGSRRLTSTPAPIGGGLNSSMHAPDGSEHTRLMAEALNMFESSLSRLPNGLSPASVETFKNAQSIVTVAERLNALLRAASTNALDEQVNAELGEADGEASAAERAAVWRAVGGEYREQLRASDELVRGLTGLLLGVGKVIKESSTATAHEATHERSASLDSDPASKRQLTASPDGLNQARSEARRSWEPSPNSQRLMGRVDSILLNKGRPPSSAAGRFDSRSTANPTPSPLIRDSGTLGEPSVTHSPAAHNRGNDPRYGLKKTYEPSPTPASRTTVHHDRSQTLSALSIPPSPSPAPKPEEPQVSLRRVSSNASRTPKVNNAISSTIRGSPISLSIPNATTAVTAHHVQNSPAMPGSATLQAFPITREHSKLSSISSTSSNLNKVTFSKPSTVSAMLNGLSERDRKRTISSSSNEAPPKVSLPITPVSGSETDKDRRRTIGLSSKTFRKSFDGLNASDHRPDSRRDVVQEGGSGTVQPSRGDRRRMISEIFS